MKRLVDFISEDKFQFQIKNTTKGNWYVDIQRVRFADHKFKRTDIYLDYSESGSEQFFETIDDALDNAVSMLNAGEYTEV